MRCAPRASDGGSHAVASYGVAPPDERESVRHGTTLPETMIVLCLLGILAVVAGLRVVELRDRVSVRGAAAEAAATFALARRWALSRSVRTAVAIDTAAATLTVRSYADTVARRALGASHGVTMAATRDSMAYAPNGLGYGASNLTLVLRRGSRAETLVVSRLGRVRR
jgi:Tfp pilus assembly protein FimT